MHVIFGNQPATEHTNASTYKGKSFLFHFIYSIYFYLSMLHIHSFTHILTYSIYLPLLSQTLRKFFRHSNFTKVWNCTNEYVYHDMLS